MKLRIGIVLAAAIVACGRARQVSTETGSTASVCVRCHGGADNQTGAPPNDLRGNAGTTTITVGAHSAHVMAGPLAPAFDCDVCHPKPATVASPTHGNGRIDLTWNDLSKHGRDLSPSFDPSTGRCSNVYCHGVTLAGGGQTEPVWTSGAAGAACGACHGIPPPRSSGHPQRMDCAQCHGGGYDYPNVNLATHVDGQVDVLALACTTCHGDETRGSTALNPQLAAAPPKDASGLDASAQVGAHLAHLNGGALRGPLACVECHGVPANLNGHPNGSTDFAWGSLATGGATTTPSFANGTCASVYCHGASLGAGGTNHAPRWSGGSGDAACGTCHGLPPPPPHVQNSACGSCHDGYAPDHVNLALHVNGQPDVIGLTCSTCHGDPARVATTLNPQLAAAPPADTQGRTVSATVGAHLAHLTGGPLRAELRCTSCHATPQSLGHADGVTGFQWDALATGSAATSPSYAGGACSATYCHGATLGAGGTQHAPAWTGGPSDAACGTCHAIPPPPATGHTQSTRCGGCHPGSTQASVNPATHVDGTLDLQLSCTSCHGNPARQDTALNPRLSAAPPYDVNGQSDPTLPGVGAHEAHLQAGPLRTALACTECHLVTPGLTGHPTGVTELVWGPLAAGTGTAGGAVDPSYDPTTRTCSNTYCHGGNLGLGGTNTAPGWTGGAAEVACGACHRSPPLTLRAGGAHPQSRNCGGCHGSGGGYSVDGGTADPATHVDGHLDVKPMTCTSCHGDSGRTATQAAPLWAAPPVDTAGETVSAKVGAHQAHLTDGGLRDALACSECHPVPASTSHPNASTDFAWGPLAVGSGTVGGVTSPSFANGTCSNTYCHGANRPSAGGTRHAPAWSDGAAAAACDACHGAPPPRPHLQNTNCAGCHGALYSVANHTADPATHVDGELRLENMTCTSCHGDSSQTATPAAPRWAAPPVDTTGATVSQAVGAHQRHLDATKSTAIACTQCHAIPAQIQGHANGATDFTWGSLATGGGQANPTYSVATATCSSTYCHGSYSGSFTYYFLEEERTVNYTGAAASPRWTDGAMTCGSCHGNPPQDGNVWHSGNHGNQGPTGAYNQCQLCHPDAQSVNGVGAVITNASLHVNGTVNVAATLTSACLGCH